MRPVFLSFAGLFGFLGLVLSALATHHTDNTLSLEQIGYLSIGLDFQLYHAIVLLALSAFPLRDFTIKWWLYLAGSLFILGTLLFSFTIELRFMAGFHHLLILTPIGGSLLMLGWLLVFLGGLAWFFQTQK